MMGMANRMRSRTAPARKRSPAAGDAFAAPFAAPFPIPSAVPFPVWVYGATRVGIPPQVFVFGTAIFAVGILCALASIVIKTAAVSDYRPKVAAGQKIKRKGPMALELEATPDILKELSLKKSTQIIVGFAAETENVLENARQKLVSKNLDAIVVNDVSREGIGFDSDRNAVTIITRDDVVEVPETTKWEVAQRVLDQVLRLRQHRKSTVKA